MNSNRVLRYRILHYVKRCAGYKNEGIPTKDLPHISNSSSPSLLLHLHLFFPRPNSSLIMAPVRNKNGTPSDEEDKLMLDTKQQDDKPKRKRQSQSEHDDKGCRFPGHLLIHLPPRLRRLPISQSALCSGQSGRPDHSMQALHLPRRTLHLRLSAQETWPPQPLSTPPARGSCPGSTRSRRRPWRPWKPGRQPALCRLCEPSWGLSSVPPWAWHKPSRTSPQLSLTVAVPYPTQSARSP